MIEENKLCWMQDTCNHCDCDSFCIRRMKLAYFYDAAMIPLNKRHHIGLRPDADGTDEQIFAEVLKQAETNIESIVETGTNFYIHSKQCGNGKTSIALRLVEAYLNNTWFKSDLYCKVLFVSVPRFLLELKASIKAENNYIDYIKNNIAKADLVIWDDIGEKAATEFEGTNLYSIIDQRLLQGKSNIFTSNLDETELHAALGDRLASRVIYESVNIELKGKDKRGLLNGISKN